MDRDDARTEAWNTVIQIVKEHARYSTSSKVKSRGHITSKGYKVTTSRSYTKRRHCRRACRDSSATVIAAESRSQGHVVAGSQGHVVVGSRSRAQGQI